MPGLDHEVHPDTVGSERYDACRTKVRTAGYWAPDTCYRTNPPVRTWVWIEDTSSVECRYDKSAEPKCEGCPRRGQGTAYDLKVRSAGT